MTGYNKLYVEKIAKNEEMVAIGSYETKKELNAAFSKLLNAKLKKDWKIFKENPKDEYGREIWLQKENKPILYIGSFSD